MRPNRLRALHAAGTPIVNGWLSIGSSYSAEIVASQGFDAVTVDCQHGMIGFDTALVMLQAISTTNASSWSVIRGGRPAPQCGSSTASPWALNAWITSRTVSGSAAISRAIAGTGVPDAEAMIMVARRTRIELPRPRRTI